MGTNYKLSKNYILGAVKYIYALYVINFCLLNCSLMVENNLLKGLSDVLKPYNTITQSSIITYAIHAQRWRHLQSQASKQTRR